MSELTDLASKRCVPCEGGIRPLDEAAAARLLQRLKPGWTVANNRLQKRFEHEDFLGSMAFVTKLAQVAEAEGHHPDFCVHYHRVDITLWTHAIGGLSDNDFILAAKLDQLSG